MLVTRDITPRASVLTAIDLDYEFSFKAHEINNEGAERSLSTKLDFAETTIAQQTPERPLGISHFPPQAFGVAALPGSDRTMVWLVAH